MKKNIVIFFILLINTTLLAKIPQVDVHFSPQSISLNDLLEVKITLENLDEQDVIISTTDFNNLGRYSFQTQIAIVNGEITQKKILYYKLQPLNIGKVNFIVIIDAIKKGPFTIEVTQGNAPLSNVPQTLQIPKPSASWSNQGVDDFFKKIDPWEDVFGDVIIKNIVSKKKLKLNEIATLKTFIYFRVNYERAFMNKKFFHQGINLIPLTIEIKPDEQEEINGKIYKKRLVAKYLFYPYQTGQLAIKEGSYQVENSIGLLGRKRVKKIIIPQVNLTVENYANPPKEFDNNWGDFTINYQINQTRAEIGTPLVLYVKVRGEGNFKILYPFFLDSPLLTIKQGETQEKLQLRKDILIGEKIFEYFIISRQKGKYSIPPITFVSYSPTEKRYVRYQKEFPELEFYGEKDDSFALVDKEDEPLLKMQFIENDFTLNESRRLVFNPWFQHFVIASFFLTFLVFYQKKKKRKKKKIAVLLRSLKKLLNQKSLKNEKENYQIVVDELYCFLQESISLPFKTIKELKKMIKQVKGNQQQKINIDLVTFILSKIEAYEKIIYSPNLKKKNNFTAELAKLIKQLKNYKS